MRRSTCPRNCALAFGDKGVIEFGCSCTLFETSFLPLPGYSLLGPLAAETKANIKIIMLNTSKREKKIKMTTKKSVKCFAEMRWYWVRQSGYVDIGQIGPTVGRPAGSHRF